MNPTACPNCGLPIPPFEHTEVCPACGTRIQSPPANTTGSAAGSTQEPCPANSTAPSTGQRTATAPRPGPQVFTPIRTQSTRRAFTSASSGALLSNRQIMVILGVVVMVGGLILGTSISRRASNRRRAQFLKHKLNPPPSDNSPDGTPENTTVPMPVEPRRKPPHRYRRDSRSRQSIRESVLRERRLRQKAIQESMRRGRGGHR